MTAPPPQSGSAALRALTACHPLNCERCEGARVARCSRNAPLLLVHATGRGGLSILGGAANAGAATRCTAGYPAGTPPSECA